MTAAHIRSLARIALGAGGLFFIGFAAPAMAQSCENDVGEFQKKRNAQMETIGKLQKKNEGKLDPVAACPMLRSLASIEQSMLAYMEKNQNWCNIPDQALSNVKEGSGKTAAIAKQACGLAVKMKKQQQQQAAGAAAGAGAGGPGFNVPAPKLPAGPL
ncbi:MAG: hypothetical protein JWN07_1278 [Hyphomicrobiales bacterium]|nr:hypothetical protein [Hyphomicrobiales bacterium]